MDVWARLSRGEERRPAICKRYEGAAGYLRVGGCSPSMLDDVEEDAWSCLSVPQKKNHRVAAASCQIPLHFFILFFSFHHPAGH